MSKQPDIGSGAPSQGEPKNPPKTTNSAPRAKLMVPVPDSTSLGTVAGLSTDKLMAGIGVPNLKLGELQGIADAVRLNTEALAIKLPTIDVPKISISPTLMALGEQMASFKDLAGDFPPGLKAFGEQMAKTMAKFKPAFDTATATIATEPHGPLAKQQADATTRSIGLLNERHARIRAQTEAVDFRIRQFEEWVSSLPGRTETMIAVDDLAGRPDRHILLRLERRGKHWVVMVAYVMRDEYDAVEFSPLVEAGIKTKVAALAQLPRLIESMVESQDELLEQIDKAGKQFDAFAALTIRAKPKEGK